MKRGCRRPYTQIWWWLKHQPSDVIWHHQMSSDDILLSLQFWEPLTILKFILWNRCSSFWSLGGGYMDTLQEVLCTLLLFLEGPLKNIPLKWCLRCGSRDVNMSVPIQNLYICFTIYFIDFRKFIYSDFKEFWPIIFLQGQKWPSI